MKIKFKQKYKSVHTFNKTEIKDFSVFLGINGAGKTHLLKGMQEGSFLVDSINTERIFYFILHHQSLLELHSLILNCQENDLNQSLLTLYQLPNQL